MGTPLSIPSQPWNQKAALDQARNPFSSESFRQRSKATHVIVGAGGVPAGPASLSLKLERSSRVIVSCSRPNHVRVSLAAQSRATWATSRTQRSGRCRTVAQIATRPSSCRSSRRQAQALRTTRPSSPTHQTIAHMIAAGCQSVRSRPHRTPLSSASIPCAPPPPPTLHVPSRPSLTPSYSFTRITHRVSPLMSAWCIHSQGCRLSATPDIYLASTTAHLAPHTGVRTCQHHVQWQRAVPRKRLRSEQGSGRLHRRHLLQRGRPRLTTTSRRRTLPVCSTAD